MSNGGSSFSGSQYQPSYQNPLARNPYNTNPNTNQAMPYGALGMPSMGMSQPQGLQMPKMRTLGYGSYQPMTWMPPQMPRPPIGQQPPPQTPTPAPQPQTPTPPPSPTPAPYSPPTPQNTPYTPDPNPVQTAVGPWNVTQGPYGGGANGLLAYNTALMFDPRAAASKPTDSAMGWNQLTGSWEAFK